MSNKRIEFIDLAKGVCILLVSMGHCGFTIPVPGLAVVRMPLYFILSGLFFKTYGSFGDFAIKKTNKILVPFLFFYLIGYVAFYAIKYIAPELLITDAEGIFDIFNNRQYFNGSLWFLLALYWCGLLFAGICIVIKRDVYRVLIVTALGVLGVYLGSIDVDLPAFIDVACTSLPFYCLGYYLKQTPILYANKFDKYNVLFVAAFYAISLYISYNYHFRMAFHYNKMEGILAGYILAICSVMFILLLCKMVKKVPIVSYFGRYSLIILCTHHMIYRPLFVIFGKFPYEFMHTGWFLALTTMLICWALIPLCIRYIPWFVAQKDLIKWSSSAQRS